MSGLCGWSLSVPLVASILSFTAAVAGPQPIPPTYNDLHYAGHFQQKLDLYIPAYPCEPLPVVLFVFGGGWGSGNEDDQVQRYVEPLLSRGFAIASVSYRWSSQEIFPAQIHDCKGAIRWLRAHADEYGLDPTRFAIFGDSSGAHLAALVGTSTGVASLEGDEGGHLEQSSAVQAVGSFAGPTDLIALMQATNSGNAAGLFGYTFASTILNNLENHNSPWPETIALITSADPAEHANAGDPPFRIVHGANDTQVPTSQAQHLHDALTTASVPSQLTILPGEGHSLPLSAYEPVFEFFQQTFSPPVVEPTHNDLHYDSHFRQKLDLYLPTLSGDPCDRAPLIMFIFGGGWLSGDEDEQVQRYVEPLLSRGFAIASLNHRLSQDAIFPAQIHDCKGAVRWLRAHAEEYRLDPDRFAIFGDSSGGHLAALVGTSGGIASLEGNVGGNLEHSSSVQAVGDFAGPTDLIALIQATNSGSIAQLFGHSASEIIANLGNPNPPWPALVALMISANPATHASADDPPFQIVHGGLDTQVPPSQAQHLHNALTTAGATSVLTLLDDVMHDIPLCAYLPTFDDFQQTLPDPPLVPGDVNCDALVNVDDLLLVIVNWGPCPAPPAPCVGDLDNTGAVNVDDLLLVIAGWAP